MSEKTLEQIKDTIPHRFENLLIDRLSNISTDPVGTDCHLNISDTDPLNRTLFFKTIKNKSVFFRAFFMEFLALGSISCVDKIEGCTYIFAGISDFEVFNDYHGNEEIKGNILKTGSKGPLMMCKSEIRNAKGELLTTANLKAAYVDNALLHQKREDKPIVEVESNRDFSVKIDSNYKEKAMTFVDKLLFIDQEVKPTNATLSYTYPEDHPCTKGHFPNNPVMMGVMQLTSVEDACLALAQQQNFTNTALHCDVTLKNQFGDIVAILKKVVIESNSSYSNIKSMKKIAFKSMMFPGDTLYTYLQNITYS